MTLIILNKENRIPIDEILMEYIYDAHENCDDSCGKKADYTDLKSQLLAEILKVIDSQEVEAGDTKDTLDGVRAQLNKLFNIKENA